MKLKRFCLAVSLVLASLISIATFAHGQTIDFEFQDNNGDQIYTVEPGGSFFVVITVDNATGVAGGALTVEYDGQIFEVEETVEDNSDYFVARSGMFVCVYDDREEDKRGEPQQAIPCIGIKGPSIFFPIQKVE